MRSFLLNFVVALLLFGGVFWYFFSQEAADIATLAQRYGVAPASDSAAPAISITPAPQPGS